MRDRAVKRLGESSLSIRLSCEQGGPFSVHSRCIRSAVGSTAASHAKAAERLAVVAVVVAFLRESIRMAIILDVV